MKESEYDVQMTFISVAEGYYWDLEVKSTKNSIFSHISCCQVTFQQQSVYENDFLKSSFLWMHLIPWPPHSICKMANHGMNDGKCHPSWLYLLQFFLQTSHIWTINKTLQNVLRLYSQYWRRTNSLSTILHFQNGLVMAHPSNWKLLEVQQGLFVYFCE